MVRKLLTVPPLPDRIKLEYEEIKRRMLAEQRLLFNSFEHRWRTNEVDEDIPSPLAPPSVASVERSTANAPPRQGKRRGSVHMEIQREIASVETVDGKPLLKPWQVDTEEITRQVSRDAPPKVSKIRRIDLWVDGVVLALRVQWESGLLRRTTESKLHGIPAGEYASFSVSREEHIVAVEQWAEELVGALRFYTSKGRVSSWFGTVKNGKNAVLGDLALWHMAREQRRNPPRVPPSVDPVDLLPRTTLIGFLSTSNRDGLTQLGAISRTRRGATVLTQCWVSTCLHALFIPCFVDYCILCSLLPASSHLPLPSLFRIPPHL